MSRAFRFILNARETFYRTGILKIRRLDHPVVSIGNLTVGGNGKTPLAIALAERLRSEGRKPVVLSRGYKRSSSGILVVSRGNGPLVPVEAAGDEPFLIARRVPGASVVVGSSRYEAGRLAEREGLGDTFILDDGFQHRGLYRDFDLVAVDLAEWNGPDRLLPQGRWREPRSSIGRAHAVAVSGGTAPAPPFPVPSFEVTTVIDGLYLGGEAIPPETLRSRKVVAFAGIAKPERFFDALERMGVPAAERVVFRDHHAYTRSDIAQVTEMDKMAGPVRITTEKDAVRLEGLGLDGFMHLRISVNIAGFDTLMDLIHSRFGRRQP